MPISVLVVSPDETTRWLLAGLVERSEELVLTASTADHSAVAQARAQRTDMILMDCEYTTDAEPLKLLGKLALVSAATLVAISTKAWPGNPEIVQMLSAGAAAVLPKPAGRSGITLLGALAASYTQSLAEIHRCTSTRASKT